MTLLRLRRLLWLFAVGGCALLFVATAPSAPLPIRVDDVTAEAQDATGADVTFQVKASDPATGAPLVVSCDHPSGGTGSGTFTLSDHFPLGNTTVTCTTVSSGGPFSKSFTVSVRDTTPPTVSVSPNLTATTTSGTGTAVTYAAPTATDTVDGSVAASCDRPSGSIFPAGTTTVTCTATDAAGNTGSASFLVTVVVNDTTPPVLTVPADIAVTTGNPGGTSVSYVATATDNVDGALVPTCAPASGSTFPVGTTGVTCTATDSRRNSASAGFTVTVTLVDTTPPVLAVPSGISIRTADPAGSAVSYTVSATDNVDGTITPLCAPASGTRFPVGSTTVTCTASDRSGNRAQQSFVVTVILDDAPPTLSNVPADIVVEADGPDGSAVSYTTPTAVDVLDGPIAIVRCSPASGIFPLGRTIVTCTASDSRGNVGTASFSVTVIDTTAPHLVLPSDIAVSAPSDQGVAASDLAIAAFLRAARATDIVDRAPTVGNDAPQLFPIGVTTVTFTARDAAGNIASGQARVIVRPQAAPGSPPLAPPTLVDRTPPEDVTSLTAKASDAKVTLKWTNPRTADFDHVLITRSLATSRDPAVQAFSGATSGFVDRGLTNGQQYRYVIVAVDRSGNASAGVVASAVPQRLLLTTPAEGARLTAPPRLAWIPTGGAQYYNVQLFRGTQKILSAWPVSSRFLLRRSWKYGGRTTRLVPGLYRWYVWPGFGPRAAARYGALLGTSSFEITR